MNIDLKKLWKRLLLIVFFSLACAMGKYDICASESSGGEEEIPSYNASGSIVQVVILYQDDNTTYHIIQSGSGILLDENTVITNRQMIVLSEENKAAAGAYLSEQLGQTISFILSEDGSGEVASYQVAVVVEADIYNMATSSFSSADWDVATLTLTSPMSKECAVLGDSDQIESGSLISVLGFPDSTCTEPKSFQLGDLMISEGVCADRTGGNINHTAIMQRGNAGGALVDEYGRVVGIVTYSGNEEGIYSALPINQIKAYLDRDGVAYREDLSDYNVVEVATATDSENIHTTIKTDLYRTLQEAKIICEEGNDGIYTEESFLELQVEYNVAQNMYEDSQAEQKEIDEETERLRSAIDGLQKVKKVNITLILIVVLLSVIVISLIVILLIIIIRVRKKKKKEKEEKQKIKTIDGNRNIHESDNASDYQNSVSAIQNVQNLGLPSSQLYAQFDARTNAKKEKMHENLDAGAGTTVLQSGEGTTVLGSLAQEPARAFLYRSATGETIAIMNDTFVIGKNMEDVDYWISDNTNISRKHARIIRVGANYYVEDLGSTNYTYVNGIKIIPDGMQLLAANDVIYFANEEFIFLTNG